MPEDKVLILSNVTHVQRLKITLYSTTGKVQTRSSSCLRNENADGNISYSWILMAANRFSQMVIVKIAVFTGTWLIGS